MQQGLANWHEDRWSEMSRGMGKNGEQLNSDEHHLRIFWRRWNELMGSRGMTIATRAVVTRAEVEDFLYHEAALLDEWRLNEWRGTARRRRHLLRAAQRPARRRPSLDAVPGGRRPRAHPPARDPHQRSQLPRRISQIAHPADDLERAHSRASTAI